MPVTDRLGPDAHRAPTPASRGHYEQGAARVAAASSAIRSPRSTRRSRESPDFVMAHVFKGYLYGLSTERAATPIVARLPRGGARACRRPAREGGHVAALGHLAEGRWHEAGRVLEDVTDRRAARRAGAAGRPPDRLLHRQFAHAARPHRARPAGLVDGHARLPRDARPCTPSGWRKWATTRAPKRWAARRSSSSRATAGRSMRWRM